MDDPNKPPKKPLDVVLSKLPPALAKKIRAVLSAEAK
jgi:hypothetical protein